MANDYISHSKLIGYDVAGLIRKRKLLFNALHHEFQHIVNSVQLKTYFDLINTEIDNNLLQTAMSQSFDEFVASYNAFKNIKCEFRIIDSLNHLFIVCKDACRSNLSTRVNLFLELVAAISYLLGYCSALNSDNYLKQVLGLEGAEDYIIIIINRKLCLKIIICMSPFNLLHF